MYIPPQRRRRIVQTHFLRQQGKSLRKIADELGVSHATVRADLKLAESHWSTLAAAAADDLLLESLHLLQLRLTRAVSSDDVSRLGDRLDPAEYLQARDAQESVLNGLAREIRRTAHDVHRRAAERADEDGLYLEEPQPLAETGTQSSTANHPDPAISSAAQEIVADQPHEEKNPPETIHFPDPPAQDAPVGDPNTTEQAQPPPIYAEAAG